MSVHDRIGLKQNIQDAFKNAKKGVVYTGLEPIPQSAKVSYVVIGCQFQGYVFFFDRVCGLFDSSSTLFVSRVRFLENTRISERCCELVRAGARLVYSCPDMYDVEIRNGNASFVFGMAFPVVTLIERVTGCEAYNLGKPYVTSGA